MPHNMCLFFVSVNHLVILLNEFVSKLPTSDKIVVVSDYDSEQLFLRWSHIASVDMLKTLKKVEFLSKDDKYFGKNDIVIVIEPEADFDAECKVKVECYDVFAHKSDMKEIMGKHTHLVNSVGVISMHDLRNDKMI